jgi:cobalt-zinc-cadmium efflux system outer membrane protein
MLLEKSLSDNLDYLTAIKNAESQAVNLKLQKSLSIPDITAGISYDQFSGAFNNEMNFSIGIPLPLWNKNKGNIKIAEAEVQQAKLLKEYKKVELESSVESLWQLWNNQIEQVRSIPTTMTQNLDLVLNGMVKNFQKRNIPLIEFIDFMESYYQSNIEIYEIKKSWILTCMNINYITNQDFFKI